MKTEHTSFSESIEAIKALTPEEKTARVALLKEQMVQKRAMRIEKERQEELEKERIRRKSDKGISEAQKAFEESETRRIFAQKKKEKEDDIVAKARVKAQIEQDKKERTARVYLFCRFYYNGWSFTFLAFQIEKEKAEAAGKKAEEPFAAIPETIDVSKHSTARIQVDVINVV